MYEEPIVLTLTNDELEAAAGICIGFSCGSYCATGLCQVGLGHSV
jgi:hypothetical protein